MSVGYNSDNSMYLQDHNEYLNHRSHIWHQCKGRLIRPGERNVLSSRSDGHHGFDDYKPPCCKEKKAHDEGNDKPYQLQNRHNHKAFPSNLPQDRDNYLRDEHQQSKDWAHARQPRPSLDCHQNSGSLTNYQDPYGHRERYYKDYRTQYDHQSQHLSWFRDHYDERYLQN